jgi:hypothetical protein
MSSLIRLYAVAIWFAVWALALLLVEVILLLDVPKLAFVILLLGTGAVYSVSERERERLVREDAKPYQRVNPTAHRRRADD